MIKSIIVDDERYTLEDIKSLVNSTRFIEVCGSFESPADALIYSKKNKPQVAFVDIEMPEMSGLTLAERLLEINPSMIIVFITAYNQYAVDAFEINALDYIMKPVSPERFFKMANRLKKSINIDANNENQLSIQCFGNFDVKIDGIPVKWERSKTEELFAYLLINHNKRIHKEKIIEDLWWGYEPKKALVILQTSVCKLRNIIAPLGTSVSLKYEANGYCLLITECKCDLLWLENLINDYKENKNIKVDIEKACSLIQIGLMSNTGYIWAYSKEYEYKSNIENILNKLIEQDSCSSMYYENLLNIIENCEE